MMRDRSWHILPAQYQSLPASGCAAAGNLNNGMGGSGVQSANVSRETLALGDSVTAFSVQRLRFVQALADFLAGFEIGHTLGRHGHRFTGARVAPAARFAFARRKRAKTAQFDSTSLGQSLSDLVKEDIHHLLDFVGAQFGIVFM
jgi:hypothetical protein